MPDYTIVGMLAVIAFLFYTIIYLLGRIFDARSLIQLATVNAAEALFTVVLIVILVNLVQSNALQNVTYQILTNASLVDKSNCNNADNLGNCYSNFYNKAFGNVSDFLYKSFNISYDISKNKVGALSYGFMEGGDAVSSLMQIASAQPQEKAGGGTWGAVVSALAAAFPSTTNTVGVGGGYKVTDMINKNIRGAASQIYYLLLFINKLYNTFSSQQAQNLIIFLIIAGGLMRILLISKGGGTFLMSLALTMHFVFPSALVFGFNIIESTIEMGINSNALDSLNPDVGGAGNLIYYTTFPRPFDASPINNLNTFKCSNNI